MRKAITVKLKPCPCCGSADLYAGVDSALSYAVNCRSCGLKMARETPDKWPRGVWKKGLSEDENFLALHSFVLNEAVEAWNKRTHHEPYVAVKGAVIT